MAVAPRPAPDRTRADLPGQVAHGRLLDFHVTRMFLAETGATPSHWRRKATR